MFKKTFVAACAIALVTSTGAFAQVYPSKPVTLVMPYAAGGPGDTLARIVAHSMTKTLKQQVLVENIGGAGGTIGSGRVAKAAPDGYTLLMIHVSHATNPALYPKLRYDAIKDFEPIGLVADLPMVFVAKKDFPANDFRSMVDYVKANKDKVTYAHAGSGSASHLCGLMFFSTIRTQVTTIPYKGAGPAMNDLLGGQVDMMCDQVVNVVSPLKAGKVKGYAVASKTKSPAVPTLPTVSESGLPGFELNIWYGVFAPKGAPKPVIERLVASLQEAVKDPDVKSRFADLGAIPVSEKRATPEALQTLLKEEIDKWGPVIKNAGVYGE
ncbi:tripartite tricarboxylate transporter substrate-binding protein [Noviherbaspirillum sp. CPCC 100848]|uniref:Tripartite tricarboxylate transporter substrate-binding protein n=1 Tax=Noviherbaspirillum album TaxID=3080276 RepID=A0ABU6JGP0_9BURK|nr:tripartite tricarboxylate transporter substrate-binding protein [Noviherbaspirillum sp. CPCC 100848]MEC4722822.1 tripartite tricarboxylate transporter substrate-binding protein [Noviherbaspirillum sp. CPCC 100848]